MLTVTSIPEYKQLYVASAYSGFDRFGHLVDEVKYLQFDYTVTAIGTGIPVVPGGPPGFVRSNHSRLGSGYAFSCGFTPTLAGNRYMLIGDELGRLWIGDTKVPPPSLNFNNPTIVSIVTPSPSSAVFGQVVWAIHSEPLVISTISVTSFGRIDSLEVPGGVSESLSVCFQISAFSAVELT